MRLLFVIYGSLDQISGGYLYDRKVIEYLREQGVGVDLLQLPVLPYLLCPLHALHPPLRRLFQGPGAGGGYDCIILDELTHPSVFLSVARREDNCPPVVVLLHHLKSQERIGWFQRIFARNMERRLLSRSDAVVVNSRTTEITVRRLLAVDVPVYICPPGGDTFSDTPASGLPAEDRGGLLPPERTVRLLITGNIIARKGHDRLIRMLGGLSDLNWELWIVGAAVDARYKRKVDRLTRRLGLEERIRYTSVLSGLALRQQYLDADIFVFPSRYEGFGISLAEAIRAGLPFVAFASGAIPEVTGGQGLIVTEGDCESFQAHLRRLISDPACRERAAELSRSLAARLPIWRSTGEAFFQALKGIAGNG
jgi:glycosyltransferase involved in cell wall biosynthesis